MVLVVKNPANGGEAKRCTFYPWLGKSPCHRKQQPVPVFLAEKSHQQRSLAGYSPWCHSEADMTEWLSTHGHRGEELKKKKSPLSVLCDEAGKHSKGGKFTILWNNWEPRSWWTVNTSSHHKIIKKQMNFTFRKRIDQ